MDGLIGVFGGTFDPPHLGHLILADEALAQFKLQKILWVLTAQPPHKQNKGHTALSVRKRMLESAVAGHAGFALSLADISRPVPHYAIGTLDWMRRRHPLARFVYLIGGDSLRNLPTWHRPDLLLQKCEFLGVMKRPGGELDLDSLEQAIPGIAAKTRVMQAPLIEIAALDIRRRVCAGLPYRYMVPSGVAEIIQSEGLYR